MKLQLICPKCQSTFFRYKSSLKPNQEMVYCSKTCYSEYVIETKKQCGENNPNYGNHWSYEQREKQSQLIKNKVDDEYRWKSGSANRGVKFNQKRIDLCHSNRSRNSYSHPHSAESKLKISIKSKQKFTLEYKLKYRTAMESKGLWIPLQEKTDYEVYFKEASWIARMFDLSSNEELKLLNEFGIFNARTNSRGVVRDHIFPRKLGFDFKIFPEIIRHPNNCQIILHSENVSRRFKPIDITVDILFSRIYSYSGKWEEHSHVLKLIDQYKNGFTWRRKE